ncbi:MAG TPA: hypothetical protein DDZ88_19725 [Verrucomicrobiales bacterium]|nr:hypothetical protein [Verrucomicrobiales bacterium]
MNEKYIRFPLWALAYGKSASDRMHALLRWAVIDAGRKAVSACEAGNYTRLENLELPQERCSDEDGEAWAMGCEILNVYRQAVKVKECLEHNAKVEQFAEQMNLKCRRDKDSRCWVMLPMNWFWRAYFPACGFKRDDPMPWDYFAVLCAIKSKIGADGMTTVTWPEIQRRSLGYLTQDDMEGCLPLRQDAAKPYSRDVIRNRCDRIRADRMVMSYTPRAPGGSTGKALPVAYGYGVEEAHLIEWAEARRRKQAGGIQGKLRAMRDRQAELARQIQDRYPKQGGPARMPQTPPHAPPTHGPTVMVSGNGSIQWKLAITAGAASRSSRAGFPESLNPGEKRKGAGQRLTPAIQPDSPLPPCHP